MTVKPDVRFDLIARLCLRLGEGIQHTMLELINQLDGLIKALMTTNRPDTLDSTML
jgi:hypothetical protein